MDGKGRGPETPAQPEACPQPKGGSFHSIKQDSVTLPTETELDLACAVISRKTIRLFFGVPDSEPNSPKEGKLLENWRKVVPERREAALGEFQRQLWEGLEEALSESSEVFKQDAKW